MVAEVGSEKDEQSELHYTTALHTNITVFSHLFYIISIIVII